MACALEFVDHPPESVRVLVAILKDEKEISRKIYNVNSTEHLIDQSLSEHPGHKLNRILKFDKDFKEYIDIDKIVDLKDFDRLQVHVSGGETTVRYFFC